jgi:molecular chaperone DnaK (HSP70)
LERSTPIPDLISRRARRRLTPSVVYFPQGDDPIVGYAALEFEAIFSVATNGSDRRANVLEEALERPEILFAYSPAASCLPEEVSAAILKTKADAERALGNH